MDSSLPPAATVAPTTAAPRRKRRWPKIVLGSVLLLALFVLALPSLLSLGFVQSRVRSTLADTLGVGVALQDYSIGWFSGLRIDGLQIDNPAGHPAEAKLLQLGKLEGDLSLPAAMRGRIDLRGTVEGLVVRVHQRADGSINVQKLGTPSAESSETAPSGEKLTLDNIRLDLRLIGAQIEVAHERNGVLESMRNVNAKLTKPFGGSDLKLEVDAELHGPQSSGTPGTIRLAADVDANLDRPVTVDFASSALDLARYRPLVAGFLGADQLTALAGVIEGKLDARIDVKRKHIALGGKMTLAGPHFAGPLLQGMELRAERWLFEPKLEVAMQDGGAPQLDTGGLLIDLDFVRLTGIPAATARELTGGRPALGAEMSLDFAKLARLGGPMPAELRDSKGTLAGKLAFAMVSEAFDPAHLREHFADYVNASASLQLDKVVVDGNELTAVDGTVTVREGKVQLVAAAGLNGGQARIAANTDLHDMRKLPGDLKIEVQDASLQKTAVGLLRYAVPVLAGLPLDGNVDFNAKLNTTLSFAGPLLRSENESVLQWLDVWEGGGNLSLDEGAFTPAAGLAQLFQLAGESSNVAFERIHGDFKLAKGAVETSLIKLDGKAQKIGLTGRTTLAGAIDYSIDIKDLIARQQHGDKILEALGGSAPVARLAGTLDAPQLALPDLGALAQQALKGAVEEAAKEALQKNVEDQLKKGLDKLIKRK
jgi:hypothetical protein